MTVVETVNCETCDATAWVCENHVDKPWGELSGCDDACGCGAGALCQVCKGRGTPDAKWSLQLDEWPDEII